MESLSDEVLVEKSRAGDMDALDVLVRRHQSWIFNLALRMVWRREVAEDATQEICIKAVTKLSTFSGQSAPAGTATHDRRVRSFSNRGAGETGSEAAGCTGEPSGFGADPPTF